MLDAFDLILVPSNEAEQDVLEAEEYIRKKSYISYSRT